MTSSFVAALLLEDLGHHVVSRTYLSVRFVPRGAMIMKPISFDYFTNTVYEGYCSYLVTDNIDLKELRFDDLVSYLRHPPWA